MGTVATAHSSQIHVHRHQDGTIQDVTVIENPVSTTEVVLHSFKATVSRHIVPFAMSAITGFREYGNSLRIEQLIKASEKIHSLIPPSIFSKNLNKHIPGNIQSGLFAEWNSPTMFSTSFMGMILGNLIALRIGESSVNGNQLERRNSIVSKIVVLTHTVMHLALNGIGTVTADNSFSLFVGYFFCVAISPLFTYCYLTLAEWLISCVMFSSYAIPSTQTPPVETNRPIQQVDIQVLTESSQTENFSKTIEIQ